jgi:RNA polymerase sigma-70 factor (ECF subfamily)
VSTTPATAERADDELLASWAAGDIAAADRLFRRHFDAVYRFLRTKVDTGLEDMIQRTFLACVEARERFRGDSSFQAYLLSIARKQVLRLYRERRRAARRDGGPGSALDPRGSPSLVVGQRQEQRVLLEGLRSIPLELQIVLELHYWEEMRVDDIAVVLEVPPGTVKSRLHRARRLLRDAIERIAATRSG